MALLVAAIVIGSWCLGLVIDFYGPAIYDTSVLMSVVAILIQTFLHTGLFITGHEAMHGNISSHRSINVAIGQLALGLYAGLDYQHLLENHRRHHRHPATAQDPDYGPQPQFLPWYISFMQRYQSGRQIWRFLLWLTIALWILHLYHVPLLAFLKFVLVPLVASSLQLFTFGIFLPHRPTSDSQTNIHRAGSSSLPPIVSLITCYHFGYHFEHHQYPNVPWYKLPVIKAETRKP